MKDFAPKKQSDWQILGHMAVINPRFSHLLPSASPPQQSVGLLWLIDLLPRQSRAPLSPSVECRFLNEFQWATSKASGKFLALQAPSPVRVAMNHSQTFARRRLQQLNSKKSLRMSVLRRVVRRPQQPEHLLALQRNLSQRLKRRVGTSQ